MIATIAEINIINEYGQAELVTIDRITKKDIDITIYDRAELKLPSFGVISNSGNIQFNDTAVIDSEGNFLYNKFENYADRLLLQSGLTCNIKIKNLFNGKTQQIGSFYTEKWDYKVNNHSIIVSLKDGLEDWQQINVEGIAYNPNDKTSRNLLYFYNYLYEQTPKKYNMLSIYELDKDTYSILESVFVPYPFMKSANLWAQWNKLCVAAQSHVYKNSYGKTVFRYNGGN